MLIFDKIAIGNKLLAIRKRTGMTQAEVAEASGLSDRTYADIERGTVNMRVETLLHICESLHISPDEILTEENTSLQQKREEVLAKLESRSPSERETALELLSVYLQSLK